MNQEYQCIGENVFVKEDVKNKVYKCSKNIEDILIEENIIEKFKITGRPAKKSYVDIKNIYNVTIDKNYLVQGHVKQPDMKKLLKLVNAS